MNSLHFHLTFVSNEKTRLSMFKNFFKNRGEITYIGNDHSFLRLVTFSLNSSQKIKNDCGFILRNLYQSLVYETRPSRVSSSQNWQASRCSDAI